MSKTNTYWNWFYHCVTTEASCYRGVELKFIYYGVIITSACNNNRAEFCGDDLVSLLDDVKIYLMKNFKKYKTIVHIKGGR